MKTGDRVRYIGQIEQYHGRRGVVGHVYLNGERDDNGALTVDFQSQDQGDLAGRFKFIVSSNELELA